MDKNSKIYIAGHRGIVGSALLRRLKADGYKVEIVWDTAKPDGTPRKLLDVSKIRTMGLEPKIRHCAEISCTYGAEFWFVFKAHQRAHIINM
ncbi:MAG: NAD-dependent epimerase/dehydratase family protein [Nitrospinae bacterium]|nr:NAD-dependent epimerase/dehydratase family protein [Nitrospinota bacterium]